MTIGKEYNLINLIKTAFSAKDYIQDGLIAMWDGIENVEYGIHDPASMIWKDLVGAVGDFHMFASRTKTKLAAPMENDGKFYYSDGTQYMAAPDESGILPGIFANKFTLEYVRKTQSNLNNEITYGLSHFATYRIEDRGSSSYSTWKRSCNPPYNAISEKILQSGVNSCHREYGDYANLLVNNVVVKTSESEVFTTSYNVSGDIFENGKMSFKCFGSWAGTYTGNPFSRLGICRIAIYDRALTDGEATHNYLIDKERFGI